ncbi:MAG: Gfo/Idh/MocA family oxidoreductase [Candidatus Omnitrophica bacterium]|nr:Gfo/Idh/MocA family oxidoreductase [Candidatus Omnitrophota bacterium]
MGKKIKVGIIGAGGRAKFQTTAVKESDIGEPLIVFSPFADEAKGFSEKHGLKWTTSLDEILENPEISAVTISTPNATHYPIAKKALEKNKNVLVEYPPTLKLQEIDNLISLAKEKKLVYWVSLTQLLENPHHTIKKRLKMLGKPIISHYTYISSSIGGWYVNPEFAGPIYTWQHFHFVSQLLEIDKDVENVCAFKNIRYGSDGKMLSTCSTMLLKMASGHISTIEFAMGATNTGEFKIKLAGENGIFYFDNKLYFIDRKNGQKEIELEKSSLASDTANFLKAASEGETHIATALEAKKILNICLTADISAEQKLVMKIKES